LGTVQTVRLSNRSDFRIRDETPIRKIHARRYTNLRGWTSLQEWH
jgi:hypothetical protein